MSFSNTAETAVLNQIFVGTALPWNANTDLWLALYTADPGEAGTAITTEAAYGSYARVAVARATDFTVSGNSKLKPVPTVEAPLGRETATIKGVPCWLVFCRSTVTPALLALAGALEAPELEPVVDVDMTSG